MIIINESMVRTERRKIGDVGEELACRFLVKQGFKIFERNYLKKWGEIDIIAQKKKKLHFIEVKTAQMHTDNFVSGETGYRPEENVHIKKLQRLHRAIQSYLAENKINTQTSLQIDVVTVKLDLENKQAKVDRVENIILD